MIGTPPGVGLPAACILDPVSLEELVEGLDFYTLWLITAIPFAGLIWVIHRVFRRVKYNSNSVVVLFLGIEPYDPHRQMGWRDWLGYLVVLVGASFVAALLLAALPGW